MKFPLETICMKCQIKFSGENKKDIINLSYAEWAQRVVKDENAYPWIIFCKNLDIILTPKT